MPPLPAFFPMGDEIKKPKPLSRRQLVGATLGSLLGWLGVPTVAATAQSPPAQLVSLPLPSALPDTDGSRTIYTYDAAGRCTSIRQVQVSRIFDG